MAIDRPIRFGRDLAGVISDDPPPHRLQRVLEWMSAERLDACVAFGPQAVTHLTRYARYHAGPSAVVVLPDGTRTLVVSYDEREVASGLSTAETVASYGERGFGLELNPLPLLAQVVAENLQAHHVRRIGVCDQIGGLLALLNSACTATLIAADEALRSIQLVKDLDELRAIGHSYRLCWVGQAAVREALEQADQTEISLFTAAQTAAQIANGEPIEFVTDLLSGPNVAEVCYPISVAGTRVVQPGDSVVADVVVGARGYWGDTAETHILGSNSEIADIRARLLDVLRNTAPELQPGNTGAGVYDSIARRVAAEFPDGEFPHHGGHGVGLSPFEYPHLIPADDSPLEPWMVIAVEPGVYCPDRTGARVENLFVVTKSGGVELREAFGES